MTKENNTIVIVGAGMAGLTAAAYLARKKYKVLLIEKNNRCGGLLHTFENDGFFFDSGPRAFVNSGIVKPMLKDLGVDWEFVRNKISIGIEDQLLQVDSMDSLVEYKRMLGNLYPDKIGDIDKIISVISEISEYTRVLYEFDNPNFVNFMSDRNYIFRKLIPWTIKFLFALRKLNQFNLPMEKFLRRLTDSQSLIDIMTQFFFRKTPTNFALGYFYVYLDYFYPKGGTAALPDLLKEKILEWGGEIKVNTKIAKVDPASSRVVDTNGDHHEYDHLIWAADLKTLYRSTDPTGLDEKTTSKITAETSRILSSKGAESVFILFAAVDRPPSYFQLKGGEHMFYSPSREGLREISREARIKLLGNFDNYSKEEILAWLDDFCSFNSYEVSIPALRDPALAPEGKTGLMISCLFDFEIFDRIKKTGWHDEFKKHFEDQIIRVFSQSIYQGFADDILFKFSSTPLTIKEVAGSSEGAITGWSFESEIPVVNKLKDIPKSVHTPIPGVYQAGQWAYAPAGVPIAMYTGWYAYQEIMKKTKKNNTSTPGK